ncbi:piggyBac transposable element-derived protein 2-like [Schistocerca nitens]|uniref:piggyBac transposable element-derived protein 2-like n=1 Tax=Schistocerca nitens TaxID=7011 RepID=UPI0021192101|nr:piggyBac transposable element-derived protein 2-like [Schistocerca nitens]
MAARRKHVKEFYHIERDASKIPDLLMSGEVSDLQLSENDESGPDDAESIPQCTRPGADVVTNYEEEQLEDDSCSTEEDDQNHTYAQDSNVEDSIIPSEWVFTEKSDIRWRRKSPTLQSTPIGEDQYSVQPSECDMTPIEYFSEYISHACLENMVEKTNMYALQHGKTFTPTNVTEIKAFLGLHIIMGCLKYPRVRMYWDSALHLDLMWKVCQERDFSNWDQISM